MADVSPNAIPNKHADWAIDQQDTEHRPYSGGAVQDFIKAVFEAKGGYFYIDTTNSKLLIFADEENKIAYLTDPVEYANLLIAELPFYEKVNSISAQSTNSQYPSAKCVYDIVGDIQTLLSAI